MQRKELDSAWPPRPSPRHHSLLSFALVQPMSLAKPTLSLDTPPASPKAKGDLRRPATARAAVSAVPPAQLTAPLARTGTGLVA